MTTLATRLRELADLEGFDVVVRKGDQPVDVKTNGLARYNYEKKAKGTTTVAEWKTNRFNEVYPGYECDVLDGSGSVVNGNTKLATVRESYESA